MSMTTDNLIDIVRNAEKLEDLDILFTVKLTGSIDEFEQKLPRLYYHIYTICKKYNLEWNNKYNNYCYKQLYTRYCPQICAFGEIYEWIDHYEKNNSNMHDKMKMVLDIKKQRHYMRLKTIKTLTEICDEILEANHSSQLLFLSSITIIPNPCDYSKMTKAVDKIFDLCNAINAKKLKRSSITIFLSLIHIVYPNFNYIRLKRKRKHNKQSLTNTHHETNQSFPNSYLKINTHQCPFLIDPKSFILCEKSVASDQVACKDHVEFFKKEYNGFSSVFTENKRRKLNKID